MPSPKPLGDYEHRTDLIVTGFKRIPARLWRWLRDVLNV